MFFQTNPRLAQSAFGPGYRLNNEKRLIEDLFKNYQVKFGRPVNNMTEKVMIYFGIYLIQLIDLDERNQVLITNVHSVYVCFLKKIKKKKKT
jgi:hypothetical protein